MMKYQTLALIGLMMATNIAIVMMLQVRSEEKRLEADFGQEYLDYKKRVRRFL